MRSRIVTISIIVLIVVLSIASVIQTPAVETASEKTETIKTETKSLETNAKIDEADSEIALTRAILVDEAKKEAQNAVKEQQELIAQREAEAQAQAALAESYSQSSESTYSTDYDVDYSSSSSTYVAGSSDAGYLLDCNDPDYDYVSYSISLSDSDRDAAERIIMGEAGSMGYEGMALVAQCLRDAYVSVGYGTIRDTISSYGYYGSMSITPSQTCKDVVSYIFDEGGAAVPHRILVFYASDVCSSAWHESQNYVISWGGVRFFDRW